MSYSSTNPPQGLTHGVGNQSISIWSYVSDDTYGDITTSGYIENAESLNLKVGDIVFHHNEDLILVNAFYTTAVNNDGSADLSNAFITGNNLTEDFIPQWDGDRFIDSFVSWDQAGDQYISTKDWQFPAASISVGEDVRLTNNAGFLSRVNQTTFPPSKYILLDRFYDFTGTETTVSIPKLDPFEWGTFQGTDTDTYTITAGAPLITVFTQLEDAFNTAEIWRGVSGKMRFDISINPQQDVSQTAIQACADLDTNPQNFIKIVTGALDMDDIDFDNDSPDAWVTATKYYPLDTVTESGTKYTCLVEHTSGTFAADLSNGEWRSYDGVHQIYKSDKDFVKNINLVVRFYSADGNDVVIEGIDLGGGIFIPYFETAFASRFTEELTPRDDTVTTEDNHWSAQFTADRTGWANYDDTATTTTPIVALAATWTDLTSDGLGDGSDDDFLPSDLTQLWDASTDTIDLSELLVGDQVSIQLDYVVTPNGNNAKLESRIFIDGKDSGGTPTSTYEILYTPLNLFVGGGVPTRIVEMIDFPVFSEDVIYGDINAQIKSSKQSSVVVNGFYIQVTRRGP